MTRFDLYTHVHKAVRALLFDAVEAVSRADFERDFEVSAALCAVRRTLRLLGSHARHEDEAIHPLLHRVAPDLGADLEAAHDKFDGLEREVEVLLARIESGHAAERVPLARRLHEMLCGMTAEHLVHMGVEETRSNRMLWAHFTDEELAAAQERIVSSVSPEEMSEWLEWMIPAGNWGERVDLMSEMRAAVPADVFAGLTSRARAMVGDRMWRELLAEADERIARRAAAV
ncbi:MAG: hypothetical protein JNL28_06385 [Planctomycetes bacterium]|nr:hypothetical protein [Planctomycetota bacterium]